MSTNNSKRAVTPTNISDETVRELLAVQRSKIDVELKQADITLKELEHNMKIADKSINAQAEDRKDARLCQIHKDRNMYLFVGFIVVAILIFSTFALMSNKEALVLDLVKVIVGFAGGFGFGWYRRSKKQSEEEM